MLVVYDDLKAAYGGLPAKFKLNKRSMVFIVPYSQFYVFEGANEYGMDEAVLESNACDLQASKKLADETMERLGYKDVAVIDTKQLIPVGGSSANADGFHLTYAKSYEGIDTIYSDYEISYIEGIDVGVGQEYINVYITSKGVMSVELQLAYELGDVISENAVIMDFDKIEEIAREQMVKQLEGQGGSDITINEIELSYMSITYDGSGYSLAPVWIYYGKASNSAGNKRTPLFAINALDGEVIKFIQTVTN